ncbi:MAG: histidine ammonia-lyase [Nitrospinae bacterium CG11_big_fil_rev_8_21_14_0_20_56_8]|nr:MAG: histidine ammonia-lyase [Nitrospinae bacterium CG11_big_fil_rev_8_21_14_0_20_56_8]
MRTIILNGESVTLEEVELLLQPGTPVALASATRKNVDRSRAVVENALRNKQVVYGITTGFGAFANVVISPSRCRQLQKNIVLSHAAGVGPPLPDDVVRLTMMLMLNTKAKGFSGIRWSSLQTLLEVLNRGVVPHVPEKGSVGASGDLAPLAHLVLALIGRGKARYGGKWMATGKALRKAGIRPLVLREGEGLALINGTQVMTAIGALTACHGRRLSKIADVAASMSLEVLLGSNTELHNSIHRLRPHRGQIDSASNMRRITEGSEIISSHKDCDRVQDAYSLRCTPQVHGASRDILEYAERVLVTEMNSATENPLIFPDGKIFSGGNFHGQPVALALDALVLGLAEWANISERRTERMVNPALSGLPSFLVREGGLNSGFMIAQYTAAALVSENKVLAHPASVDSIPTSGNKEDHVSMGTISARKAMAVMENLKWVLAIELLCGAQALDLFTNLKPGRGTLAAYRVVRKSVPHLDRDRELAPDIETVAGLIDGGEILNAVEAACGSLV